MLLTINGYHDNHNGQPGQGGGAENLPEEVDSQGDLEKEIRSDQYCISISPQGWDQLPGGDWPRSC